MANKDGIVSIGFDYKKELDEVCATIEKELNNLGGDINLSDGIKKQMTEVKKMITDMKKDIGSSFDKITETKLDTKTFESFKKDVNKRIREINKEVTTLKEQFSTLDGSANVNGIVQQFANLKKHVEDSNASISEFINNSEKLGKSVIISPNLDTDSFKNEIAEIKSLLTKLGKEDFDFGYSNKSAKELGEIARELVFDYRDLSEEIEETKSKLNSMNNSDKGFKEQEAHLSKLSLELIECGRKIDDVFGSENSQKVDWEKYLNINEIDEISKYVAKKTEEIRANAQQIINSITTSNNISSTNKNNGLDNTNRSNNIEIHISTKQSTINKQLDEMIDNLQQRAANKPIIAPVKLRVDSEYEKTTKDASASALTENQINEARKDVENVVPGLEKAFNNSMRIATNKAVENAKESIKAVREFFETNPITVHLTVPEDERLKIGKSILSEDGKTTVDISGQVDKARKSVKGLSEDLEKSQLLIKENAQNAKNLSLEKLVNSLSETMTQFSELKGIISSIQNMENTIARASGISSTNELVEQWSVVEKTIINATKLDGDFRKNANIGKIVSEYQKYIDMGGTNTLSSIDKIKDNETTINSILSKMKELKSQDIENSSIQKLSVDLDGVIAKFDELISTVKTATNALYKIIKQGNVSDLDKQWSSISSKFKSIADESGKINLGKQKTDIKELMDMYQKYENAGGTNSLMSLTDNVETLRKLDKEYQKLNQTQSVDNSSTIEKESESFKSVEKSVDSLTTAIGDTKVQAINVEATAMEDAAEREIMAIKSILDNLDLVVSRLKDIKSIKLPKIEVKNIGVVEKAVESLENAGNKSNISSGTQIKDVFQGDGKSTTDASTTAIKEESQALEQVSTSAKEAATSKEKFANANKEVKASADSSKTSISEEEKYFNSLGKSLTQYQNTFTSISRKPTDGNRSQELQEKIDIISSSIEKLNALKSKTEENGYIFNKNDVGTGKQLEEIIKKNIELVKQMSSAQKGSDSASRMKEIDKLTKYLDKNTRISKEAREQLQGYLALLKSDDPSVNVKELHTAWTKVAVAEREAGREGKSFLDIFKNKVVYNYAAQLAGYYLSFMDLIRYGRNAVSAVQELDTALVDLKKTTTMSASELERFYYDSNDVAKQMGTTTAEIINQASAWSRLGYSTKEASTQMAELSAQFAAISPDLDLDSATDGLVSSMKAFDIEVTNVERDIMDNINRIGNTAATSNGEIVDMLTRSSAAMAAANNTIQETIALETAAVEITRNAETTGTAFKTLSMRIRGYDESTEELSDDLKNISGDIADLTKTASTPGGISLFTDETKQTYKSTYQILKEISDIYDELSDKNRAELLEKLAGKRGGQVVAGLLSNFDAAEKALREMENAAGSADAEMSIVEESIDYKLNKLEQTWVGTAQAIVDRGDFGKAIDVLTKLSEAIGWVIDKFGVLGTASVIGGGILGAKNVGINTLVAY